MSLLVANYAARNMIITISNYSIAQYIYVTTQIHICIRIFDVDFVEVGGGGGG